MFLPLYFLSYSLTLLFILIVHRCFSYCLSFYSCFFFVVYSLLGCLLAPCVHTRSFYEQNFPFIMILRLPVVLKFSSILFFQTLRIECDGRGMYIENRNFPWKIFIEKIFKTMHYMFIFSFLAQQIRYD